MTSSQIDAIPSHRDFTAEGTVESILQRIFPFFKKRHYTVSLKRNGDETAVAVKQGAMREAGSALLHFGLIPLLIGGLVGKMMGFSYLEMLGEGESAIVRERDFFVRCDFFELERNEHGAIKDYKSGLTLLDSSGDTLAQKTIEVNHPLVFQGIKIYQSSYRSDPTNISDIRLVVNGPRIGAVGKGVVVQPGAGKRIDGTEVSVMADRFIPDFVFDMEKKAPISRSAKHNNPALHVTLTNGNDTLFARWVFQKFGAMHHADDAYSVSFQDYSLRSSTGLLIKENPGGGFIWLGIVLMSIGILMVFWIPRRRLWLSLTQAGENVVLVKVRFAPGRNATEGSEYRDRLTGQLRVTLEAEKKENHNGTVA
jgi:cytochrome c biogenesis protein ResB